MNLKAKKNLTIKNKFYEADEEISLNDIDFDTIVRMNEKGLIYPLTLKELLIAKAEIEKSKIVTTKPYKYKKEEEE